MTLPDGNETKLLLKGHEVVVHTAPTRDGGFYAFAVLLDPFREGGEMKSFEVRAVSEGEAEVECARQALLYLEQARAAPAPAHSFKASRSTVDILGRKVDIFCDLIAHDKYQAFPFLYRPDGKRVVILRFHLDEAIVGDSADEARDRCLRRLEEYFDAEQQRAAPPADPRPPGD
jgi:hypothetical protein